MTEKNLNYVYVVGGAINYANWLPNTEIVDSYEKSTVVMFTGGSDVSPSLYGDVKHKTTVCNPERDEIESKLFKQAVLDNKHVIGICRGAQLSCVMSGGKLVQHQQNNDFIHPIKPITGADVLITSTHHQAMFPFFMPKSDYLVLGSTKNQSKYHLNGLGEELNPPEEVEICYFSKTKALAIQGHPESLWHCNDVYSDTFSVLHRFYNSLVSGTLEKGYLFF